MKLKTIVSTYLFEILLFLFSVSVPFALSMGPAFYGIIATFLIFLVLRRIHYVLFVIGFVFVLITCVLFLPQIIWFGHPPATMIGAFFETDFQESKEFVQSLPLYAYAISLVYLLFGGYILYLGKKKSVVYTKKYIVITVLLAIVSCVLTVLRPIEKFREGEPFLWAYSRTAVIGFYGKIVKDIEDYHKLKEDLEKGIVGNPSWQITDVQPPFNDYILVIGESVRRDYMSLYGFPLENSSFLKAVNGTVIEGYTAAAPNTSSSLLRMFVQQQNEAFLYANNIISLAKLAGFETIWLSNQGYAGGHDSPVTKIANLCDKKIFTKKSEYASMNYPDSVLLPTFEKQLQPNSNKRRLIVLHLLGSHTQFASRLENPIHYDYVNKNLSAYVQTLEQTDIFLQKIYQITQKYSKSFTMIYFSDHGLMTQDRESRFFATLTHGDTQPNKAVYRVPFVLVTSKDTLHRHIKVNKSAFHFLDGYAHWLGIKEKTLDQTYDFCSKNPDSLKVFNHFEDVSYESLADDAVVKP
ncbi:sulfatase-like hydrolase/transferase [Capnocytophaga sp.]|uniref:sulfatase-like hydrolase/transferase n=1 Tax=Capnocytophaga sp. TaxID=44737 RepID=UPI0026DADCBA|nr:sulfatase-like hydrolase/transferase [Capnocytophaga sp.]MDO5104746.1 sulfatase-like hydrolase/transferase [Capnocytophaga sp.]